MKLSKTLKLTLAALAAGTLISAAEADNFAITVGGSTITIPIPPTAITPTPLVIPNPGPGDGVFDVTATAMINPAPPAIPALDLAGGVTFTGTGPATITLCVIGNNFVPAGPLSGFVGGSFQLSSSATIFETILVNGVPPGSTTNTVTLNGTGGFNSGAANITAGTAPFSLEDCVTITFNGAGFVSFDAGVFRGVPDNGTTAVLLGIGLLAIGGVAKFRKAKLAA